ncbi:MAG: glycosyltransferase family 4 protein [Candidatus Omnitrophica bacterium]|nr:glycosyltransferase family 4 protein [Candidatus Omnitrophota bacterium]
MFLSGMPTSIVRKKDNMLKVCFISHSFAKGGAELALLELISALQTRGVKCHVILPWWGFLNRTLSNQRVPCAVVPYLWWMGKTRSVLPRIGRTILNLAMSIFVAARIRRWRCDIIYTNTITVCVGATAAMLLRRPHVLHIHEFGRADQGLIFDFGENLSLRFMNRFSSAVIACSHAVAQTFQQRFDPGKLKTVYYSVKIPVTTSTEQSIALTPNDVAIRCVVIANLQKGKGQEDAIRAIAELVNAKIYAELLLIGRATDSNYAKYLRRLTTDQNLEGYVKFIGYSENPFPFIQRADVVVSCSRNEAFGRAAIEAMRASKPVIGTRSAATLELIRDGWNGLLYTPGNYAELKEKIQRLCERPDLARHLGKNGQQWAAKQFTDQKYGEEVMKVLRGVTKQ